MLKFKDQIEALEIIQQICNGALELRNMPPKASKSAGRPIGTVKRQIAEGSTPQRLEAIRSAVMSFIPLYRSDWTSTGRPSTIRVREMTGFADITHWEIQLACPGYSRTKAEVRFQDRDFLGQDRGNWYFEDTRDGKSVTVNLHTTDIDEARRLRDLYLRTGKWYFQSPEGTVRRLN